VNESTSFCFTPAPKETYACVCGGTGLVRCGGTSPSPAKRGCDNNATSSPHAATLELSGLGGGIACIGCSALSMYANGSEPTGPVSMSAHENGADAEEGAASESGECEDAEVVAKADQGEREEDPTLVRVPLPDPPLVMRDASECDKSDSVTEEVPSMVRLGGPLTGIRRGCSPYSSSGRAGPCRRLATAVDAVQYNHAIGTGSLLAACSAASSLWSTCFCVAGPGPEESSTGSPTGAFPLLMEEAVSRKLVYPPPGCGGSMSMSCI
jgi:hypothetical protein